MDNSLRVGRRQSIADLDRDFERARQFQGMTANQFADIATGNKLHHDKMQAIKFGQIMNCADVGMIQGRGQLGLALKAFAINLVNRKLGRKQLEGYGAVEFGIEGLIDRALAALAKFSENFVLPDALSLEQLLAA